MRHLTECQAVTEEENNSLKGNGHLCVCFAVTRIIYLHVHVHVHTYVYNVHVYTCTCMIYIYKCTCTCVPPYVLVCLESVAAHERLARFYKTNRVSSN